MLASIMEQPGMQISEELEYLLERDLLFSSTSRYGRPLGVPKSRLSETPDRGMFGKKRTVSRALKLVNLKLHSKQ